MQLPDGAGSIPGRVDHEHYTLTARLVTLLNPGSLVTSWKAPEQHSPSTLAGDAAVLKAQVVGFLHGSQSHLPGSTAPARLSERSTT